MAGNSKPENALARNPLTQERLKELLNYDPETGILRWIVDRHCGKGRIVAAAGDPAGSISKRSTVSYIVLSVDNVRIFAHRLAFLYMTGEIPDLIDHADCDGINNRWVNLREATKSQNNANARTQKNNKIGVKGVMRDKHGKKWVAQIKPNRKSTHLGTFDTIEEAKAAYAEAATKLFGEFARMK